MSAKVSWRADIVERTGTSKPLVKWTTCVSFRVASRMGGGQEPLTPITRRGCSPSGLTSSTNVAVHLRRASDTNERATACDGSAGEGETHQCSVSAARIVGASAAIRVQRMLRAGGPRKKLPKGQMRPTDAGGVGRSRDLIRAITVCTHALASKSLPPSIPAPVGPIVPDGRIATLNPALRSLSAVLRSRAGVHCARSVRRRQGLLRGRTSEPPTTRLSALACLPDMGSYFSLPIFFIVRDLRPNEAEQCALTAEGTLWHSHARLSPSEPKLTEARCSESRWRLRSSYALALI